ncbi:MAG TPA: hypothetical protein VGH89_27100 [Pseudonocardia sp.]|jgi:hypothetical protein
MNNLGSVVCVATGLVVAGVMIFPQDVSQSDCSQGGGTYSAGKCHGGKYNGQAVQEAGAEPDKSPESY